jgi:hypothetical protein
VGVATMGKGLGRCWGGDGGQRGAVLRRGGGVGARYRQDVARAGRERGHGGVVNTIDLLGSKDIFRGSTYILHFFLHTF